MKVRGRAPGVGRGEHMSDLHAGSRSDRLDRAIHGLLSQTPEIEAAAVVSFDGLPMASALPQSMDEDRVAAMSAALLSLGERAAQGLGRGELSQVYIEGDAGTVFLISADDEAVLVAVAAKGAKVGMMLYEVRRAAAVVAAVLRAEEEAAPAAPEVPAQAVETPAEPLLSAVPSLPAEPVAYAAPQAEAAPAWQSYAPSGSVLPGDNPTWS
jgi:predicted regulator of Ras-like GTPase activity (Roadblock/LC7/MglB family)